MKIVIWGAGVRGKRIFTQLGSETVVAIADNDDKKSGTQYMDCPIISLEQYIESYSEYFILISMLRPESVMRQLEERGIHNYFSTLDCPSEISALNGYGDLKAYLKSLDQGERYGIYGINFYSLYCYEKMWKKESENVFLIPEVEADKAKVSLIGKAFDFVRFLPVDDCENRVEKIFVATGRTKDVQALKEKIKQKVCIENIFDLSRKIPDYRNPEIAKFKDIHKGKRCFIVATGPSLTMDDLDILYQKRESSIGMNRVYLAFEKTRWRPDYYMINDWRCIRENSEEIKTLPVKYKFISDSYKQFWEGEMPDGIYKYHLNSIYMSGEKIPFSDDLVYGVYDRATVTYSCIQLAVYLGFKEIYLLGVDFDFSENYKDKSNHFIESYYTKDSETSYFLDRESLDAYMAAREYAESHGIKIYNATRGGKLEVFERVNFDDLFEK